MTKHFVLAAFIAILPTLEAQAQRGGGGGGRGGGFHGGGGVNRGAQVNRGGGFQAGGAGFQGARQAPQISHPSVPQAMQHANYNRPTFQQTTRPASVPSAVSRPNMQM